MLNSIISFLNPFNYNVGSIPNIIEYATANLDLNLYFQNTQGRNEGLEQLRQVTVADWNRTGVVGKGRIDSYNSVDAFSQDLLNNGYTETAANVAISLPSQRTIADSSELFIKIYNNLLYNNTRDINYNLVSNPREDYRVGFDIESGKMDISNTYVVEHLENDVKTIIAGRDFTTERTFFIPKNKDGAFNEGNIELKIALKAGPNFKIDDRDNFNEEDYQLVFNNQSTNQAYQNTKFHYNHYNTVKHYLHEITPSALYIIENEKFLNNTYNDIISSLGKNGYVDTESWKIAEGSYSPYLGAAHGVLSSLDSYATGNFLPLINSGLYNSKIHSNGHYGTDLLSTAASMLINFYAGGTATFLFGLALEGVKYGFTHYGYEKDSGIMQGLDLLSSVVKFYNTSSITVKAIEGLKVGVSAIKVFYNTTADDVAKAASDAYYYGAKEASTSYEYTSKAANDALEYLSDIKNDIENSMNNLVHDAFNYLGKLVSPEIECSNYNLAL